MEWRKNLKKDESRVGRLLSGKYTSLILIFHFQITVHLESKTFSMRPPLLLPKPKHSIVQKKIPQPTSTTSYYAWLYVSPFLQFSDDFVFNLRWTMEEIFLYAGFLCL